MGNIAIYAGSFDPFTNGHLSIVKEACNIFDVVYLCLATNSTKQRRTTVESMESAIIEVLDELGLGNVIVISYNGLIADLCMEKNISYLIRGLRDTSDYLYEENIAKLNVELNPTLKTIYFRAELASISSSMIRELHHYGKDISKYIPDKILKIF